MAALEAPGPTGPQKAVLLALCARADQHKCTCTVGLERLAADAGLHRATVVRAVADLRREGHISLLSRVGRRNTYHVHVNTDPSQRATSGVFDRENPSQRATGDDPEIARNDLTRRIERLQKSHPATGPVAQGDGDPKESYKEKSGPPASPRYFAPGTGWIEDWSNNHDRE
jgi:hypothetical protein